MRVKQAMHEGAQTVTPAMPVTDIARMMAEHDIGAVPVVGPSGVVGIVTDRDLACRALTMGKPTTGITASDIMTDTPVYCRETEELGDAIHLMEDKQVRRLPVLDDNDRLVGILSLGDVAHATSQDLTGELTKAVSGHHHEPELLGSDTQADQ